MSKCVLKIGRVEQIKKFDTTDMYSDYEPIGQRGKRVGSIDGFDLMMYKTTSCDDGSAHVFFLKEPKNKTVIGYITLKKETKACFSVEYLNFSKLYAGRNLAYKMYVYILRNFGYVFQIGSLQTAGSRKLWYKLGTTNGINVFAHTEHYGFIQCDVDHDKRELRVGDRSPYRSYHIDEIKGIYASSTSKNKLKF